MDKKVLALAGGLVAAVVGVLFVKELLSPHNKVSETVDTIIRQVKKKVTKKRAPLKKSNPTKTATPSSHAKLLSVMKKGTQYTQVELQSISKIPYRSVRRYVESLVSAGKISETGYGKGKRFTKK